MPPVDLDYFRPSIERRPSGRWGLPVAHAVYLFVYIFFPTHVGHGINFNLLILIVRSLNGWPFAYAGWAGMLAILVAAVFAVLGYAFWSYAVGLFGLLTSCACLYAIVGDGAFTFDPLERHWILWSLFAAFVVLHVYNIWQLWRVSVAREAS
jgi:hypothetical protein